MVLNIIGITATVVLLSIILVIILSLVYVILISRKNKLILKISVSVLDFFHLQLKMLLKKIFPRFNFDHVMIVARNELNRGSFEKSEKRIFLAPHCLRSPDCPASTTQYGVQCKRCGKCQFDNIMNGVEKFHYSLFILAGSSFVKKLIEETKPDGILLLGCAYEINKVMMALDGRITYGITLLKDGCVNTISDLDKVISTMQIGKLLKDSDKINHANR